MHQSVRDVWAKFKAEHLSHFCTEARQMLTSQKAFPSEIDLNKKTVTPNSLYGPRVPFQAKWKYVKKHDGAFIYIFL